MKIKNFVEKFGYRKLSLWVIGILILALIVWGIKGTHAFYSYSTNPIQIFNSRAGNFAGEGESVKQGPLTDKTTDVNLIYYLQMPDNADKYMETTGAPASGYKLNEPKSNCYPEAGGDATYSNYSIEPNGTVSITYTEGKPTQVVCRIYYDRDKLSDVIIYAYVQDASGDRTYNNQKYKLVNQTESTFKLVGYKCNSSTAKTTLAYNNGFTVTSAGPDTCYAYFSKS